VCGPSYLGRDGQKKNKEKFKYKFNNRYRLEKETGWGKP
jgi:hypothetical protein